MKKSGVYKKLLPVYLLLILLFLAAAWEGDKAYTVFSQSPNNQSAVTIIIDPGHGGMDSGATSYSGIPESKTNLQISRRLNDLFHLLGYKTIMTRLDDNSIETEGNTIASRKMSDMRNRVKIVNQCNRGLLISIHQNYYPDISLTGAQIFHNNMGQISVLAEKMQQNIIKHLKSNKRRKQKTAERIYLMNQIKREGLLIECGFISNPQEDLMLNDPTYQKKLCTVIACSTANHLSRSSSYY